MIDRRNGTLRRNRKNENLLSSPFRIDDRSFWDIMGYMTSYMEKINFFDLENKAVDKWDDLMMVDPIIFMVSIINEPTVGLRRGINTYEPNKSTETQDVIRARLLLQWYYTIETWRNDALRLGEYKLAHKISNILTEVLEIEKDGLEQFIRKTINPDSDTQEDASTDGASAVTEEEMKPADIDQSMHTFYRVIMHIQEFTRDYLVENIEASNTHAPNNAMYITFALLYKHIQKEINTLSQRHLDFYYKDVLHQENKPGTQARAIVNFDLLPTVDNTLIDKGMRLSAGKLFGSKQDILFETQSPMVAYQMELVYLQTLFLNESPYLRIGTNNPIVSSVAWRPLITLGEETTPRDEWYVFGANKSSIQDLNLEEKNSANLGCIIGSQVLALREGDRSIDIVFAMEETSACNTFWQLLHEIRDNRGKSLDTVFYEIFSQGFTISYTTEKGWVEFERYTVDFNEDDNQFIIGLQLKRTDPVLQASTKIAESLKWPSIKIQMNAFSPAHVYSFFREVDLERIDINVSVSHMKDLSVYNNVGKMALDKPFELFGPLPDVGSYLMVGNSELFGKDVTSATLDIDWEGLPTEYGGLETYYAGYPVSVTNDAFKVKLSVLSAGFWLPVDASTAREYNLFSTTECVTPEGYQSEVLDPQTRFEFGEFQELDITPDTELKDPLKYSIKSKSGFMKLTLTDPPYGFGAEEYQEELIAVARYNATKKAQLPDPNKPLVPKTSGIRLSYSATDSLLFKETEIMDVTASSNLGEYFHIEPHGAHAVITNQDVEQYRLFPSYSAQGYLEMGIKTVETGMTISMYFHFLRSSTSVYVTPYQTTWEYYKNDRWNEFEPTSIITDGTSGFIRSGIVELVLPRYDEKARAEFGNLIWIRISVKGNVENYPKIKGIYLNAAQVTCVNADEDLLGKEFPSGSIQKVEGKYPDIKAVYQPAKSFSGNHAESDDYMYMRISERLRHKGRCVNVWDFEHLILENFDTVRVVKCTNFDENFKPTPGRVKIAVLSKRWTNDERYYFNRLTLSRIQSLVDKKSSPFLNVEVINPNVEYLLVNCVVHFKPQDRGGYYLNKLNKDISDFLSPVSDREEGIGGIGGRVIPNMLSNYVNNLSYVEKLEELNIEHIVRRDNNDFIVDVHKEGEVIRTSVPWAILVPVTEHNVQSYQNDDSTQEALKFEIGNMQIGQDFIIGEEEPGDVESQVLADEGGTADGSRDAILVFKDKS